MFTESSVISSFLATVFFVLCDSFFVLAVRAISRGEKQGVNFAVRDGILKRFAGRIYDRREASILSGQMGRFISAVFLGSYVVTFLSRDTWSMVVGYAQTGSLLSLFLYVILLGILFLLVAFIWLTGTRLAKAAAYWQPERSLEAIAVPFFLWAKVTAPIASLLNYTEDRLLDRLDLAIPVDVDLPPTPSAVVQEIFDLSEKSGGMKEEEKEIIRRVFTFGDTVAREVMTPRKDIISITLDTTVDEIVKIVSDEGLSRVLVTGEDLDDVKGVFLAKDLVPFVTGAKAKFSVQSLMTAPCFVKNTRKLDDVFRELRKNATHFAVVLDEHGGVDGIITMEDLMEEIFGDIFDEFDEPSDELEVRETKSGDLIVDGSLSIDDLNVQHGFSFPRGEYDTVAGFVIHHLGRIPRVGEIVNFEGVLLKVEEIEDNRVTILRLIGGAFSEPSEAISENG